METLTELELNDVRRAIQIAGWFPSSPAVVPIDLLERLLAAATRPCPDCARVKREAAGDRECLRGVIAEAIAVLQRGHERL